MTISLEKLTEFSSKIDDRFFCRAPFQHAGRAYATNGNICIELDKSDPELPTIGGVGDKVANLLRENEAHFQSAEFKPLEGHPERIDCPQCCGTGTAIICAKCKGNGCIGADDRTCEACNGYGETQDGKDAAPDGIIPCWFCDGSGEKEDGFDIGAGRFNTRYLRLIASLPGARFAPNPTNPEAAAALFVFDGGRGALMPIRK